VPGARGPWCVKHLTRGDLGLQRRQRASGAPPRGRSRRRRGTKTTSATPDRLPRSARQRPQDRPWPGHLSPICRAIRKRPPVGPATLAADTPIGGTRRSTALLVPLPSAPSFRSVEKRAARRRHARIRIARPRADRPTRMASPCAGRPAHRPPCSSECVEAPDSPFSVLDAHSDR